MNKELHKQLSIMLGVFCLMMAGGLSYYVATEIGVWNSLLILISLTFMQVAVIMFKPYRVQLKDISKMKFSERLKHLFDTEDDN